MVSVSSGKDSKQDVQTPPEFIEAVEKRFGPIGLDLAASAHNKQADKYFGLDNGLNSLEQDWREASLQTAYDDILWLNPPFSDITPWAKKCAVSNVKRLIVMLVPASVGANWYRDYCFNQAYTLFLNGRIKFIGHDHLFPKDLMLCVFNTRVSQGVIQIWDWKNGNIFQAS